jgi:hypothetical protein
MSEARKKIHWPELILCIIWIVAALVAGIIRGGSG